MEESVFQAGPAARACSVWGAGKKLSQLRVVWSLFYGYSFRSWPGTTAPLLQSQRVVVWQGMCAHLCLTLCNPTDCSPPGSSVHGISQARILEQVAISYSSGSFWPRDQTCVFCVSCIGRWILYHWCHLRGWWPDPISNEERKRPKL